MMSKKSTANFRTGRVDVSENGRKPTVLYEISVFYPAPLFDLPLWLRLYGAVAPFIHKLRQKTGAVFRIAPL